MIAAIRLLAKACRKRQWGEPRLSSYWRKIV